LPERTKDEAKLWRHNRGQVKRYLLFYDSIHKSAAGSEVPAGKESKGMRQYASPVSSKGYDHIDDPNNRRTATMLSPVFAIMRRSEFPYWYACGRVAGWVTARGTDDEPDHGTLDRWEEEGADALAVFNAALDWAADRLEDLYPGRQIYVDAGRGAKQAKTRAQAGALDRWERGEEERARALAVRYRRFKAVEDGDTFGTRRVAKDVASQRLGWSVPSIRDAIRFAEQHEWPDGEPVRPELRYPGVLRDPEDGEVA
jgi:hypothetical protein